MSYNKSSLELPLIRIIEEPARGGTRFRYECEGRSAGSIPGANSTPEMTTYPAIQIMNFSGSALVIVSCVTKDFPYRQHPHNLVGDRCMNGICKMIIDNKEMIATFPSIGIQCAKRNDIRFRLRKRQALQVDPFGCGFDHMQSSSFEINLSAVRLCFQVLIEDPKTGQYSIPLQPVVSDVIFDKKSCNELNIIDMSTNHISCNGSKLMLFTSFVTRDDIDVRFFQTDSKNNIIWSDSGVIAFVYRHIGISLLTPKYPNQIKEQIYVYMQLRRPSDQETSSPIKLEMNTILAPDLIESIPISTQTPSMLNNKISINQMKHNYDTIVSSNSWKEIAQKKPDFNFPILKAAIKRPFPIPQKLNPAFNFQNNQQNYNNSISNKLNDMKQNNQEIKDHLRKMSSYSEAMIPMKACKTSLYDDQQQEYVIDLTKTSASKIERHNQNNQIYLDFDDKNDFSCQVNTIDSKQLKLIESQNQK